MRVSRWWSRALVCVSCVFCVVGAWSCAPAFLAPQLFGLHVFCECSVSAHANANADANANANATAKANANANSNAIRVNQSESE